MKLVKLGLMMLLATLFVAPLPLRAAKMKPEEVVAKHLASIGTPEARAAIKSRSVEGDVTMEVILGGKGTLEGPASLISAGARLKFRMNYNSPQYPGEEFTFDGDKPYAAMYQTGSRTKFGGFVLGQDVILKEGLLGGTLSTAWPLLDVSGRGAKLSYDGLKKVNGRELHQLTYSPRKGGGDLTVRLYFEPETFRHVYSVYTMTIGAQIGTGGAGLGTLGPVATSGEESSARQVVTRIKLEEFFSDFGKAGDVNLPAGWTLKFTTETERGTTILECRIKAGNITNNASLPDDAFHPIGLITRQ